MSEHCTFNLTQFLTDLQLAEEQAKTKALENQVSHISDQLNLLRIELQMHGLFL